MSEIIVHITAEVNPTEDPEKVETALENLFSEIEVEFIDQQRRSFKVAKISKKEGIIAFYTLLRKQRILSAARRKLIKGISEKQITFYLNKQAAYMGRISFSEPTGEHPLGSIKVVIECENAYDLVDWITPRI